MVSMAEYSSKLQMPDTLKPARGGILDYIFFLRPMLHPPVWTIVILGYYRSPSRPESISVLILLLAISSAAAGWAYVVNQITDVESDRINNKLYFLPRGLVSLKASYIMAFILFSLTLIGGFLMSRTIALLFGLGLILGYAYSAGPLMGKNRPVTGAFINGMAHGILPFMAGQIAAGGDWKSALALSVPYFFAVVAVFIGTTIPDISGDSRIGKITPAVVMGTGPATVAMTFSVIISIVLGLLAGDTPLAIAAILSLPFYIVAVIRPSDRAAVIAVKISVLFLSLAACWRFWPYAVTLIVLLVSTRAYYRRRFGLSYPSIA